jgi:hypothetical protein
VIAGKWFYVVETTRDGGLLERNQRKLFLGSGVTDENGFVRIEVDRSEFKDRFPLDKSERSNYTLVSYPKNNKTLEMAQILSESPRGICLFSVQDKDFEKVVNNNAIYMNLGTVIYLFPKAFDSLGNIPVLNADFESLKFFESGYDGIPDRSQRVYNNRLTQKETRYINWELNLKHPAPGRRIHLELQFVCKRADTGEIVVNEKVNSYIDSSWISSNHPASWGSKTPGAFWKKGVYALSTYVNGNPVAMRYFGVF